MITSMTFGRTVRGTAGDGTEARSRRRDRSQRSFSVGPTMHRGVDPPQRLGEIRRLALEPSFHRLLEQLERCGRSRARSAPAVSRLRLMLEHSARWAFDDPEGYWLVLAGPHALSPEAHETTADLSARCYEIFAGVVRELAAEGRLRIAPAESAAQTLWQAGLGLGAMARCLPAFRSGAADELMSQAVERLIRGCLAD